MRLGDIWQQALSELEAGRVVYVSFVVAQKKGTPGTTAARMLLTQDGQQQGTIGGGIMESELLKKAQRTLAKGERMLPSLRRLRHRRDAEAAASGLICGGEQTNLEMILCPATDLVAVQEIVVAIREESSAYLEISSEGLRLVDCVEPMDTRAELKNEAKDWRVRIGFRSVRRIAIYGGGHCGEALAELMHRLDYDVTIIDSREAVLSQAKLPGAVHKLVSPFEGAAAKVSFPERTIAVVMTYSMPTDVEALCGILSAGFAQAGLMGSPVKIAFIREQLKIKGFSDLQIDLVRAPIGLKFDSDTPAEIAVSIAAQILLER